MNKYVITTFCLLSPPVLLLSLFFFLSVLAHPSSCLILQTLVKQKKQNIWKLTKCDLLTCSSQFEQSFFHRNVITLCKCKCFFTIIYPLFIWYIWIKCSKWCSNSAWFSLLKWLHRCSNIFWLHFEQTWWKSMKDHVLICCSIIILWLSLHVLKRLVLYSFQKTLQPPPE